MSQINVLILGKSGCGKSSLLNYLWGKKIAEAGAGRPVTPKAADAKGCGIYPYPPIVLNDFKMVVHDSWGIEADKAEDWRELIIKEAHEREDRGQITDWFHTVIYCISAKGARVEDYEFKAVINPLIEQGFNVVFALTKSDIASDSERRDVRNYLQSKVPKCGAIIDVSNLGQKLRNGRETTAFGDAALLQAIMTSVKANLIGKIRAQFLRRCNTRADQWKEKVLRLYDQEAGFFSNYSKVHTKVADFAASNSKEMAVELKSWMVSVTREAQVIFNGLGVLFGAQQFHRETLRDYDREIIAADLLKWDWTDNLTETVFQIIPILNMVYAVAKKGMHRDMLAEKLDKAISVFKNRSIDVSSKLDSYLGRVLAIPTMATQP